MYTFSAALTRQIRILLHYQVFTSLDTRAPVEPAMKFIFSVKKALEILEQNEDFVDLSFLVRELI